MLNALDGADDELFWRVFLEVWSACDGTEHVQDRLIRSLRGHGSGVAFLSSEARDFFSRHPDPIPVFRGCSRARVRRISWTTNEDVALAFVRGHRAIAVPEPVLASALVPKSAVFAVFLDREESEVLLDPDGLP
jgi:hypothetical protein